MRARDGLLRVCLPWRHAVICMACIMALCFDLVDCMILPPISWNASNPMFKTSNNDHVIQVNMFDELDFICPQFSEWEDTGEFEFYIIYQVSKREYDDCNVYPENKPILIVNCSSPFRRKRYTVLFEPFVSIPSAPEFDYGGTYYYISTSTGTRDGIMNSEQGACYYRNMKLTIKVCCESTTTSTTTTTTPAPVPSTKPTPRVTRPGPTRKPHRGKSTTVDPHSIKYTDKTDLDKTSRTPDKDKVPPGSGENDVNKQPWDEEGPRKQGQVNSAQTLVAPSWWRFVLLTLVFYALPWRHR